MPNQENHRAANGIRLGVLIPSLLVLLFALLGLQKAFDRPNETQTETKPIRAVPPVRNPSLEAEIAEPIEEFPESVSKPAISETPRPKPVPAAPVVPVVTPPPAVQAQPVVAAIPAPISRPRLFNNSSRRTTESEKVNGPAIIGKITVRGTPPPNPVIDLKNSPDCGRLHRHNPIQPFFVVGEDGALAEVVVSIKGGSPLDRSNRKKPLFIDQKDCMYVPYVAAVQVGQKIVVKNSDSFLHNVHTTPNVPPNKEKNTAQFANKVDEFVFDAPEKFLRFKCDVHPWMFSYVTVFDHPHFTVTSADGRFVLQDLAPGQYVLEAAHRKAGVITREVKIRSRAEIVELNLEFELGGGRSFTQAKANP